MAEQSRRFVSLDKPIDKFIEDQKNKNTLSKTRRDVQYCAKVMQTIIDEYRALFSRFIADISAKHRMDCRTLKRVC